jgi:hypothetical protein
VGVACLLVLLVYGLVRLAMRSTDKRRRTAAHTVVDDDQPT